MSCLAPTSRSKTAFSLTSSIWDRQHQTTSKIICIINMGNFGSKKSTEWSPSRYFDPERRDDDRPFALLILNQEITDLGLLERLWNNSKLVILSKTIRRNFGLDDWHNSSCGRCVLRLCGWRCESSIRCFSDSWGSWTNGSSLHL